MTETSPEEEQAPTNIVFEPHFDEHFVFARVDINHPNAWMVEPGLGEINKFVKNGFSVIVRLGDSEIPIFAQGMDPVLLKAWVDHVEERA